MKKRKNCDVVDLTKQTEEKDLTKIQSNTDSAPDPSQIDATPMFSLGLKEFYTQSQGFPSQNEESKNSDKNSNETSSINSLHNNSVVEQNCTNASVYTTNAQEAGRKLWCYFASLKSILTAYFTYTPSFVGTEIQNQSYYS